MSMSGSTMGAAINTAINALPVGDSTKAASDPANVGSRYDPSTVWAAVAGAIVTHIAANATVTIKTTDGSLQTTSTVGVATTAPSSNKTLPAGCIA